MDKKFKFTNANIKNLPAPTKRTFVYDTIEVGLSLQITPNGAKSFYYRGVVLGKQIRVKLGEPSYMSVDDARQAARKAKINMKEGINPIEERKKITGESSLEQLYTRFMDEKEQHIRPITMEYYKDLWKRYLSTLANKKISQITPDELKILHKRLTLNNGKRCANQTIVLLRTIYNHFIKQNIYQGFNPGNAVQLNKQIARTRHLSGNELESFRDAINETEDSIPKFAIMMLWFTGARRRNVFSMKWEDIKLEEKLWTIPETKTQNDANVVLVNAAIDILNQLKDMRYNEYVFFSTTSKSGHIGGVRKTWEGILKRAKITNFHLHDLRHTFATSLLANGADAFMVKKALTHKSLQSTQIYVNLEVDDLREKLNETVNKMIGKKDE
jgi:integrase